MSVEQRSNPVPSRPKMPAYYDAARAVHDTEKISWPWASERLANARNYWIATTNPDSSPHTMPVWGIWLDETFYFDTGPTTRSGRNIAANQHIIVHLESGDNTVILEGTVAELHDPAILERYVDACEAKYSYRPDISDPNEPGSYVFRPHKAFTWMEGAFATTATRWTFDQDTILELKKGN